MVVVEADAGNLLQSLSWRIQTARVVYGKPFAQYGATRFGVKTGLSRTLPCQHNEALRKGGSCRQYAKQTSRIPMCDKRMRVRQAHFVLTADLSKSLK